MKKITVILGLVTLLSLQGCAAVMASNQPHKKNLTVLEVGKHRNYVISELGAPVTSETVNGERKEIYTFKQGYSKAARISRTLWHTTADIASIGLWEVIGSPVEMSMVSNFRMKLFLMTKTMLNVFTRSRIIQIW